MRKIFFLSLGCDKNRVDGEVILGQMRLSGCESVDDPAAADTIIVNTCGFIADAVRESIDTILELAEHKKTGACNTLIVTGCMATRYRDEIRAEIPEVDYILGVGELPKTLTPVDPIAARLAARRDDATPHIAYIKVSDGCDNNCTYCTIPSIRGPYRERPQAEITAEARALAEAGAREIVLVAQDVARYSTLPRLLHDLNAISEIAWIRIMYAYPEHITDELLDAMAALPKVCEYLDMPIQHCREGILRRMGRQGSPAQLQALIEKIRAKIPDIALRSTVMVGFPGESSRDFHALTAFLKQAAFARLGAFPYSAETGTPAAEMPAQVRESTKQARLDAVMEQQRQIHFGFQESLVGRVLPCIVDGEGIARTRYDAYESDGVVHFTGTAKIGEIVPINITAADGYDLRGEVAA
jgi:ribosomal protein S12 methylthiotransferase